MNTLVNVARYHLVDRISYVLLPIGIPVLVFLANAAIIAMVPTTPGEPNHNGGLVSLPIIMVVLGTIAVTRALPFGFAVGLSRRTYFVGTVVTVLVLGAGYALGITALQALERATNGWGLRMQFFRVAWLLDGPLTQTWLTTFVVLLLFFAYGMWIGLIYRRFTMLGMFLFISAQIVTLLAAAVLISWTGTWSAVFEFLGSLSALGLTGVLALVTAVLAAGGYTTMRRVTV